MSESGRHRVGFGPFIIDLRNERLERGGEPVPLRPKTFAVLRELVLRPGVLVSKRLLLDSVWPEGAVSDTVLKVCIRELRVALGDAPASPCYIENMHGRGYRLIAPLERPPAELLAIEQLAPLLAQLKDRREGGQPLDAREQRVIDAVLTLRSCLGELLSAAQALQGEEGGGGVRARSGEGE